jgi:hypothetical protein
MSDLRAFAVTEEDLHGFGNRDSAGNRRRDRRRRRALDVAVPGVSRFPGGNESLGFIPVRFASLLAVELPAERARDVNEAGALFPAAASFFELPRRGVLDVAALAFFAVSAIELDSLRASAHFRTACTVLHAGIKLFALSI